MGKVSKKLKQARPSQLTPNFNIREFKCKDGKGFYRKGTGYIEGLKKYEGLTTKQAKARALKLAKYLEKLRSECGGRPLYLTSVYRTPLYNQKVGGEQNSAHLEGFAADILKPRGMSHDVFRNKVRRVFPSGCGSYASQGFVHGDFSPSLGYRNWNG